MRRQHTFRAARHDEGDLRLDRARLKSQMRRERSAQSSDGVFPGKIVDPAVALGLAEHGDDRPRQECARVDQRQQTGDVARPGRRNTKYIDRHGGHGDSASLFSPTNYGISPMLLMTTVVLSKRAVISSVSPSASM